MLFTWSRGRTTVSGAHHLETRRRAWAPGSVLCRWSRAATAAYLTVMLIKEPEQSAEAANNCFLNKRLVGLRVSYNWAWEGPRRRASGRCQQTKAKWGSKRKEKLGNPKAAITAGGWKTGWTDKSRWLKKIALFLRRNQSRAQTKQTLRGTRGVKC